MFLTELSIWLGWKIGRRRGQVEICKCRNSCSHWAKTFLNNNKAPIKFVIIELVWRRCGRFTESVAYCCFQACVFRGMSRCMCVRESRIQIRDISRSLQSTYTDHRSFSQKETRKHHRHHDIIRKHCKRASTASSQHRRLSQRKWLSSRISRTETLNQWQTECLKLYGGVRCSRCTCTPPTIIDR